MKTRLSLFGLIFAFMAFSAHAQIYQVYTQDFETGSPVTYQLSSNAQVQTSVVSGGNRSMKLSHVYNQDVMMTLDTIDFSEMANFNYYTMEFMHYCEADARYVASATDVCVIEVRRPGDTRWTRLGTTHYNMTDGGSSEFSSFSSFSKQSYTDWENATMYNPSMWRHERFDLDQLFQNVLPVNRKLVVRFVVYQRNVSTATTSGWYIDDIVFRASSQQMITPRVKMLAYPDMVDYPSSRGAYLCAEPSTVARQGINGDSVYAEYRVGNSRIVNRAYLHRISGTDRFAGRIPFYGYDTMMYFHLIVKDSTNNNNTVTFPTNSSQWVPYRCVRGRTHTAQPEGVQSNNNTFPFPAYADNRSEFFYDSTTMAEMGYGPGGIKQFRMIRTTSPTTVVRPRLQIWMANVSNTLVTRTTASNVANETFYSDPMQLVYDSAFVIDQAAPGSYLMVTLQDTFFYAGGDLIVQVIYDGNTNPQATSMKHIPTLANKNSLFIPGHSAAFNYNVFGNSGDMENFAEGTIAPTRPWVQFYVNRNQPLLYDCGISGFSYPSYNQPCNAGTDSVVVWLKNFGERPMDAVRIAYKIDNGSPVYVNWTGHLNGGDSVRVQLSTSQSFSVGYHTIRAWVDDTITVGTSRFRDHEPLNDTSYTPFAACSGAYNGTRTVGPGGNFATLEQCLYVLSRCGINNPLTIKLPAGTYDVVKFPYIPGTSATKYVQFEPATTSAQVTFRRSRSSVSSTEPALVDLTESRGIRFNRIRFANGRYVDNRCDVLAQLGEHSAHCQFLNCQFVDSNTVTTSAQALIHTGSADSVLVQNCSFYGGTIGVSVEGTAPDIRSRHNIVQFNEFANQVNTAISLVNQSDALVDSNFVNDVQTNASYIILGQYVYDGSRITRNRVYSTHGACCIGVSDMHGHDATGNQSQYSIVANNMLVSLDDGTTNMLTTPLNIIKGSYLRVVFNSVRMSAPSRVNIAAATFGGGVLSNSYFQNNVVATFDTNNYAFAYIPGNNAATNHVDYNCYHSVSGVLNKLTGVSYYNLNTWRNAISGDQHSVVGNPQYTNGGLVDLRSFNDLLRNVGTPVPGVTTDIEGTPRNATNPSLGAYEVRSLTIDFKPVTFITPLEDYCGAPSSIPVKVCIQNMGIGTYTYSASSPITVFYSINNAAWQNFTINRNVGPGDTIQFLSTRTMQLPYGSGNSDVTYNIRWCVKCNSDPNNMNDTAYYQVISRYAAAAPTTIRQNCTYGNSVTITPTQGVNTWPVHFYTSTGNGRQQKSGISWYHSMDDTAAFYYGNTYQTEPLYAPDTFYISQKRNLPLVKITEVQVNRTAVGATNPMPSWMNAQTNFAIELTNCGDYPANLEGDSIVIIQTNQAPKYWVLPRVTIQPGNNLVLQFKVVTTPSDSSRTIYCPSSASVSLAYNTNFAVIYRDKHGIADAVPFNSVITSSSSNAVKWSTQGVPNAVWYGAAVQMGTSACAGARRISWPASATSLSQSAQQWQVASNANPMHIGETETQLIRYYDNGCEGARGPVYINVPNVPVTDLAVDVPVVDTGCNLTTAEPVTVTIHNYGSATSGAVTVKYSLNNSNTPVGTGTIPGGIPARSSVTHIFSTPLNMRQAHDSIFNVKVWVDGLSTDASRTNDTSRGQFMARYTPNQLAVTSPRQVLYGGRLTLTPTGIPSNTYAIWMDAEHNVIDTTTGAFITPNIYHRDTFYVKGIGMSENSYHVGTLASTTSLTAYPSPYNPKTRYTKEQYIYTAQELLAAGHSAGSIRGLAFKLASVGGNNITYTYSNYTIKMGATTLSEYANTSFITTGLTPVYNSTSLTLSAANVGWVYHQFQTPYEWDGVSNIVVEINTALSTAGINTGASTYYTTKANSVITKQNASSDQSAQTTGAKGGNRPDVQFTFYDYGCEGPESLVDITVTNVPPYDLSLSWDPALDTMVIASCAATNLNVQINNRGNNLISSCTLKYKIDNGSWSSPQSRTINLSSGRSIVVPLLSSSLTPGRHTVIAVVQNSDDTIHSNDTIVRTFNVRFCAGDYTVGSATGITFNFPSLAVAIDTLHNAGVAGPIRFLLNPQTFSGQVDLNEIDGADDTNTITFITTPGAADQAKITFTTTSASNYVMALTGTHHLIFDNIYFYANYTSGSGNNIFANVLKIEESNHITFRNCVIRSKATTASSTNANLVLLGNDNNYLTFDHNLLDSGYYAIRTLPTNTHSYMIDITNNDILHFWYMGINLRNVDSVTVLHDSIAAGVSVNGKPLTGVFVADGNHISIQKNFITLADAKTGGKRGIHIVNCKGTNIDRVTIYNNMIALRGIDVASLVSSGIWIDTASKYVNVLYNTVSLKTGDNKPTTRAFSCQQSSNVHVLNNIFENQSQGYAYYVAIDSCVSSSNFNAYWSNAEPNPNTGVRKFAFWGAFSGAAAGRNERSDLDSLRTANHKDVNSVESRPYFVSDLDLRLALAQFAGLAQYNSDVPQDIFDSIRPQIPTPTIGAHEFARLMHDIAIVEVVEPMMPRITVGNNAEVYNIETDSIMVRVRFYNNGQAPENSASWTARIADYTPEIRSVVRNIRLPLRTYVEDSVKLYTPLGLVDTQRVVIELLLNNANDNYLDDNVDTVTIFLYPAYDLKVVSISFTNNTPAGCRLLQVPLTYKLKNEGKKDFPGNFQFNLGYEYELNYNGNPRTPTGTMFQNYPGYNADEIQSFGEGNDLPVGTERDVVNSPANQPDLYPRLVGTIDAFSAYPNAAHGYNADVAARLRGWVRYQNDVKPLNDTSTWINIRSNYTPAAPVGSDTLLDYGTYGNFWATQDQNKVIRWHRDTLGTEFFYSGSNNYARSTHWSTTPQYFHDSTYYLSCLSAANCTSYYSPINVAVNPPIAYDCSISKVLSPRASGRVYLEVDTVKLRVVNYGSNPISNIPIAYKFMDASGRITYAEVHDTVRATIAPRIGDSVSYYDFVFDTALLTVNRPTSNATFTLQAWVYMPNDQQTGNDTLRTAHTFRSLAENTYDSILQYAPTEPVGFDITRVSYSELDNVMPDLIGYTSLELGRYNRTIEQIPCAYFRHGTRDTLTIEVANNENENDTRTAASLCVAIDYNRDGQFDLDGNENITKQGSMKGVKVRSRTPYQLPLTIPSYAHYGYMRMLVWVSNDSTAYISGLENTVSPAGQMQQYLIFIQEPGTEDSIDAAITRVVYPRNHIVDTEHYVAVILANKGRTPLTQATVEARFINPVGPIQVRTINWTGNLAPGTSEMVRFDSLDFYQGTTDLQCIVHVDGDSIHTSNDTLLYQYHRNYVVELRLIDDFDVDLDMWYAPVGYNAYTRNYFERGTPAKSVINSAYSQPNAYVTSTQQTVSTGRRGNRSVLYTPVINISQIRPDTISFLISKNMANESHMRFEYLNYMGEWVVADDPEARWGSQDTNVSWYDEEAGWTGNTPNGGYVRVHAAIGNLRTEFPQRLRFRFVFTTPPTSSSSSSFGDGVAIDNFRIDRSRLMYDAGIVDITYPTEPQFGQTIKPKVVVHNYGTAPVHDVIVSYRPYGIFLPMEAVCHATIEPDSNYEFECPDPFVITNRFPDTFQICAFTRTTGDIYDDNDTTCKMFGLSPLQHDLYMYSIVSPLNSAVAGDSINITVRLRNFGQEDIDECDVYYTYNDGAEVHEHIVFRNYLGRGLQSTEFFNYTFRHRERTTMGTMQLTTRCSYSRDVYPYNDTVSKSIQGIAAITDLHAVNCMVDKRNFSEYHIGMMITNVGARMANNFTVGYWYDKDTTTKVTETFYRTDGLASGESTVYMFQDTIRRRTAPYEYVTCFLAVDDDTNKTNDTTTIIVPLSVDMAVQKVQVEENRSDSCRVRMVVSNLGNITYVSTLGMEAIINGERVRIQKAVTIDPQTTRHIMFDGKKILKDPGRNYVGSGRFTMVNDDTDPSNNQTTIVEVVNYFEGIPTADDGLFVLEQNYPNPFEGKTQIEFALPYGGSARFFVSDALGRTVYEHTATYDEGRHTITFDRNDLSAGVYYYGIEFDGERRMHKMILR